ncbi:MAG TPA: DUF4140 domain-containing protein, partial [Enhygromyxa sp.]|nr:DUF4140 domain-containing protein [Enhygromyxa sp.]
MDGTAIPEQPPEQRVNDLVAEVPVVEVTLLEDRALVVRRGVLELPPGRSRLRIDKVAPVLVDKTLSAALTAVGELPDELRVRSASVTRRRITRDVDRPSNIAELRERRRAKQTELEQLEQRRARAQNDHASLNQLLDLTITEITEDVSWAAQ